MNQKQLKLIEKRKKKYTKQLNGFMKLDFKTAISKFNAEMYSNFLSVATETKKIILHSIASWSMELQD